MILFPAIDLKGGDVVRLAEGAMDRATVYGHDPAARARAFAETEATHLHVVDLDGAFAGAARNAGAVEAIVAAFPGKVQLGGGIRSRDDIERWLAAGVWRVVIGTAALENPALVRQAAAAHSSRIVVAVDARGGLVATRGWAAVSDVPAADLGRRFEDAGVAALLFTDVGRDGLMKGVNLEATVALAEAVSIPVIASGGAASIADVRAVADAGLAGLIVGRALYDGRIDLAEALAVAEPLPFRGGVGVGLVRQARSQSATGPTPNPSPEGEGLE